MTRIRNGNSMRPHPKPQKRKKVRIDWSGFAIPKLSVKREGYEYTKFKNGVIESRGKRCEWCKKPKHRRELTLHHKTKRSKLRLDTPENVEVVCLDCHIEER